jgi:hypothetical protein
MQGGGIAGARAARGRARRERSTAARPLDRGRAAARGRAQGDDVIRSAVPGTVRGRIASFQRVQGKQRKV